MSLNIEDVKKIILAMNDVINDNKEELSELDAVIGDGDHGHNMAKGFSKVKEDLENNSYNDIGTLLKKVGIDLVSNVGGASGPLYGTAFMKAGASLSNKEEMNINDFSNSLEEAVKGVKMRGKANIDDKTMIDVLEPVSNLIKDLTETNDDKKDIFNKAVAKAYERVEYTKDIIAKKGRASYLGERSIGHKDPGAQSSYLLIKCISDNI
ncbi:dihydroxyacetone kinase-like protein [Clostridium moniliforme]|uniref:Dihydroxyacetone kinase-like protein n=1 Tax=Clostridium moniliforme TaxID=39489 RepID=A0ABS4EWS0_9CLOT|nr:dihydroxyacetone kinase subunit DhaL [Clostridium moniliforme]MBP1888444.1 dihydroxyacetone kinase-like protein [Clostridium moniliforme]